MKKLIFLLALAGMLNAAEDGATVYKKCVACHGVKAEKVYLGKIPALSTLTKDEMLISMKAYKAGTLNKYKQGPIMKGQMATLDDEKMNAVATYITSFKK